MHTVLAVTGMTCDNCVNHVTTELKDIAGVTDVSVNLDASGTSQVTVTAEHALSEETVREAIDEAGYDLVGMTAKA